MALFYTARPQLAWIFLSLLSLYSVCLKERNTRPGSFFTAPRPGDYTSDPPWGSSAKSTIAAEIILGLISLSIYGRVAHLGSTRGYYKVGSSVPSDAKLMYAAALLYIVSFCGSLPILLSTVTFDQWWAREDNGPIRQMTLLLMTIVLSWPWIGSWLFWEGYVHLEGKS